MKGQIWGGMGYPPGADVGDDKPYIPHRITNQTRHSKENNNMGLAESKLIEMNEAVEKFIDRHDKKMGAVQEQIDAIDKRLGRNVYGGGGSYSNTTGAQAEHHKAFMAWARKGTDPDGLRKIEASLSTLEDPSGGYLVPIEIEKSIDSLARSSVAMRRLARVVTSQGDYKRPISRGGCAGDWVTEKASRPETDASTLAMFSPAFNELYAAPKVTQKLLDQSDFDLGGWITEEINDVFNSKEGTGFISGDGVGKPHGIIDESRMVADASWAFGKTGYIASGHASLLSNVDKLIDVQSALKPVYRRNGVWLMNDNTLSVIRKMKDGSGNYVWVPGLMENAPDLLLGRPVEVDENMPDIGAGAYPICFGDYQRAYTIVDHTSGVRLLRDPFSDRGFVTFYTTKRVAAGLNNSEAIKFLKISI